MVRLVLVRTSSRRARGWQIHSPLCTDLLHLPSINVEIISAESPEALVREELRFIGEDGWTEDDFKIMPCCLKERTSHATG